MAEHNELGRTGEDEACFYLAHEGYTLLDRNWRHGHLEIDIVAELFGEIVFVEVKTRARNDFGQAFRAVDLAKKQHLLQAAMAYLHEHHLGDSPFRWDIITVVGSQRPFDITHYPFAYSPEGVRREKEHRKRAFEV